MRKRIFYYYMSGTCGGADHSLFHLVKHLDKQKYEPFVYYNKESYFNELLKNSGAILIKGKFKNASKNKVNSRSKKEILKEKSKNLRNTKFFYYFYSLPKLIATSVPEVFRIYKILKKYKIDIIHLNHSINDRSQIWAALLARIKIIVHYRGLVKPEKIDVFTSRYVDKIICISEFVKQQYVSYGVDEEKCMVIYKGVEIEFFNHQQKKRNSVIKIVNIGRLEEWKGQHIFLQAAADLLKEQQNLQFLIVGNGPKEDELKEMSKKLRIEEFVEFRGFIKNIPEVLRSVDILVHSSIEPEPFGRVVIEGMAAGLPVVSTNIGGPKEIIQDGVNGFLVESNDWKQLKAQLAELLINFDLRMKIGNAAEKRVKDEFNSKKISSKIERLYE